MKSIRCELNNRERSCSLIDKIQTQNEPLFIQRALIVREPYASMIVTGTKIWEIRGSNTKIRGTVGIIAAGTGTVIGRCDLLM
ncbi:ASCH domain-containing protein [Paenibacillus sp. GYB004]|uniref:ASCH domain-containing protein n=1 Tax=Paenibacillus sp. GYB004 TaxID=2994393 RepID=UPI003FA6A232